MAGPNRLSCTDDVPILQICTWRCVLPDGMSKDKHEGIVLARERCVRAPDGLLLKCCCLLDGVVQKDVASCIVALRYMEDGTYGRVLLRERC